jgi:uncharacterized protein (DUF433 family)
MTPKILGHGIYTFPELARLTRTPPKRVRAWFLGADSYSGAFISSDYSRLEGGERLASFLDLIEILMTGRLRQEGVSLQYLRKVHRKLSQEFRTSHPFCRKDFFTDGRRVFVKVADEPGEEVLREILSRQSAFVDVLMPYLKQVDYDHTSLLAKRCNICKGVVLDPEQKFGKPIVSTCRIPTNILSTAYYANGSDSTIVADWYGIRARDVEIAVKFEHTLGWKAA